MTSPTTTHRLATPDGRQLAVDVTGPAEGPVLLFLHSAPGSRRFDPDPTATEAAGVRMVTFDRAGYGASSPFAPDVVPTVGHHAADAALVVASLQAGPVDVAGWSAGGRVGAALAATHPDLVRSLAIIATPAPDDEVPWVPEDYRTMAVELRQHPSRAMAVIAEAFTGLDGAVAADEEVALAQATGGPADDALLAARPDLRERVVAAVRTGFAPGVQGVAADIVADQVSPWGFDRSAISCPTTCWYGNDDPIVSPAHGAWWAADVAGARLTEVPGVGHLVVAEAWADILAARP